MTFAVGTKILIPSRKDAGEPALPSKARIAKNFVRTVIVTAAGAVAGEDIFTDDATAAARMELCRGCEFFRASDERCAHRKCGCYLNGQLLAKTKLKGQRCPDTPPKWREGK